MPASYIVTIREARGAEEFGRKAEGLRFLMEKGFRVPSGFVVRGQAMEDFHRNGPDTLDSLRLELASFVDARRRYAVRSSSNQEDAAKHSFAGQFKTILDQEGVDRVLEAIKQVWLSSTSAGGREYAQRMGEGENGLRMAVIVQEMVPQAFSGVAFSRNPLTGEEEEVIEAVAGSGEALVQEGATPMRWIVSDGEISHRPTNGLLPDSLVASIARSARRIAADFGRPVDLEWVYDGQDVQWVQLRQITALGRMQVYSNAFSKEVLPGMIKPLVWSINIPLVNGAWIKFLSGMTGVKGLKASELAKQFYYRAYFNMTAMGVIWERMGMPKDSLERLTGMGDASAGGFKLSPTPKMLAVVPNLANFLLHHFALPDKLERFLPAKEEELRRLAQEDISQLSEEELLQKVDALSKGLEDMIYYNVVTPLAANMFNRMLESRLRKAGVDPSSTDALKGLEGVRRYYPDQGLRSLHQEFLSLDEASRRELKEGDHQALAELPPDDEFRIAFDRFLQEFGHISESGNDFSAKPWREDPGFVLTLVMEYPEDPGGSRKGIEELDLGPRRRSVMAAHRRARRLSLLKERTSSTYSYGYGLYRNYFMQLGRRFVAKELLAEAEDIFYLNLDEVRQIVAGGCAGNTCNNYRLRAAVRKREMLELRDVDPPSIIYGEVAPPLAIKKLAELRGTPTSGGYYRGVARVVRSPGEFSRVQSGDVIVIPYSDVAWTPLFAKAGAVVAESGGMLSHSSIVAREYGIPAVVSVRGAMLIPDGVEVSVDGYTGAVALSKAMEAERPT